MMEVLMKTAENELQLLYWTDAYTDAENEPAAAFYPESNVQLSNYIDRYLYSLFLQIGIPANKLGYRFLREAVHLVLRDPSLQHRLMRGLYPQIAERFRTSVYCVEHSMRCAITSAWNRGRPELVEKLLGRGVSTSYDKPTNGELIALVAENLRLLISEQRL